MKNNSLLRNAAFNGIKTFSDMVFPVVTFAYAARILGEEGIGRVNFSRSVVSYFVMLAMLGMQYYGAREAAGLRDIPEKLGKFVQEMLLISTCTTTTAYILLFWTVASVPKLHGYKILLFIASAEILLKGMGMEWLYQAVEEYRYIAVRSVVFQIVSLAGMFLFVRNAQDVVIYEVTHLMATSGSQILNFFHAGKYLRFYRGRRRELKKHLKPLLWLFAVMVSVEIYTVLDSTMLGFLKGDAAVGRYTAAVKINKMVVTLISSVGSVLLPRLSYYIARQKSGLVRELVVKMYNYMFMISVPASVGLFLLSDEIILLFSGSGFATAAKTMRVLTPIVIIIPFNILTHQQLFVPMGQDMPLFYSTLTGAITNFAFNLLLIPHFAENGAAIATVLAEMGVSAVCLWNIGKFYSRKEIFAHYWMYWVAALPIPAIAVVMRLLPVHYAVRACLVIVTSIAVYFGILWVLKPPCLQECLLMLQKKFGKYSSGRFRPKH